MSKKEKCPRSTSSMGPLVDIYLESARQQPVVSKFFCPQELKKWFALKDVIPSSVSLHSKNIYPVVLSATRF